MEFKRFLQTLRQSGTNVILSQEHLWSHLPYATVKGDALYQAMNNNNNNEWDTTVVFVYRRLYELIPSLDSELHRPIAHQGQWPNDVPEDGEQQQQQLIIPGIAESYDPRTAEHMYNNYTQSVMVFAQRFERNMTILNLHGDDLVQQLLCTYLRGNHHACAFLQTSPSLLETHKRESVELDYDRLAVQAYRAGYLAPSITSSSSSSSSSSGSSTQPLLQRTAATWRIQRAMETMSINKSHNNTFTVHDFPQICLDDDILQDILHWSKRYDRFMLKESSVIDGAEGERQFERDFATLVTQKRFCSTNVEKVVTDASPQWQFILHRLQEL